MFLITFLCPELPLPLLCNCKCDVLYYLTRSTPCESSLYFSFKSFDILAITMFTRLDLRQNYNVDVIKLANQLFL